MPIPGAGKGKVGGDHGTLLAPLYPTLYPAGTTSEISMHALTRIPWLMAAATLVMLVGCQRPRPPESFISADAVAVVAVPRIDQAMGAYKTMAERFADLPAVNQAVAKGRAKVLKAVGLDLDRPESLVARGIDTKQGLYGFLAATADRGCLVAAETDRAAADGFLRELVQKVSDKPVSFRNTRALGLALTEAIEEGETKSELAWIHHRKSLLVCAGDKPDNIGEYLARMAQAKPEQGMVARADYQAVRASVAPNLMWVYVEAAMARKWLLDSKPSAKISELLQTFEGRKSIALALDVAGQAVTLRFFLHSSAERAAQDSKFAKGQGQAPNFQRFLPPSAALLLFKVGINMPAVVDEFAQNLGGLLGKDKVDEALAQLKEKSGLDIKEDVLSLLSGRFLLGFDRLGIGLDELRNADNPTKVIPKLPLYLLVQITDRGKAAALLATVERLLRQAAVPITVAGTTEPTFTVSPNDQPLFSFGLREDVLLISTAEYFPQLIERSRAALKERAEVGSPQVAEALRSADTTAIYVELAQTAALLHALTLLKPDKDIDQVLPVLDKLRDLAILSQWRDDGALAEFQVRLR